MEERALATADDVERFVRARDVQHAKLGVTDVDGILRGKYLHRDKLLSAVRNGFGFCDVVLGWDSADQLYDDVKYTGWHTAYPDAPVRVLPSTARLLPFEQDELFFLCEFTGAAEAVCPRGALRRVLDDARRMGFGVRAALEYEFFVFDETPDSVREKGYRNLRPFTPGMFGYSVLRATVHNELYRELMDTFAKMDVPIEGLHTETGPGVLEAAITVSEALEAADRAVLFKTFTKAMLQRRGKMATFMAKWSNAYPGQSGHIHVSLVDLATGEPVFHDPAGEHGMSATMRHFVAGQQRLMPTWLATYAQTVNAFSRLVPGFWAPTDATWGVENRTTALRVIPGSAKSQRVEVRVGSADANPYIALASAIASGLHGVREKLEPTARTVGNAYAEKHPESLRFPRTLHDAACRFEASPEARQAFGDAFVEHFAETRRWEEREFQRAITDWELARYFEIQ